MSEEELTGRQRHQLLYQKRNAIASKYLTDEEIKDINNNIEGSIFSRRSHREEHFRNNHKEDFKNTVNEAISNDFDKNQIKIKAMNRKKWTLSPLQFTTVMDKIKRRKKFRRRPEELARKNSLETGYAISNSELSD